jgi:hypothetical protein
MTDKNDEIRYFLENIPDAFQIMETGIDIETQKEYFEYSDSFDRGQLSDEKTLHLGSILHRVDSEPIVKRRGLTLLAHLGTITAYRQIEKYYENPDPELKAWAALALQECRMFLESTLLDDSVGFIATGLGGLMDKMRFYFLVLSSTGTEFTATQQEIIESELGLVAKNLNCIVETLKPSGTFVELTALVPHDVAVATFIESGIEKCNALGNIVLEHYYVTNQSIPDAMEIHDIIRKVRG